MEINIKLNKKKLKDFYYFMYKYDSLSDPLTVGLIDIYERVKNWESDGYLEARRIDVELMDDQ